MKSICRIWICALTLGLCALAGCESGGHFTIPYLGYTTRPPFDPDIRTVYVPIPLNVSWIKNIEFDLEQAVLNELNMRAGAPRVTSDRNRADTELLMKITNTTKAAILINQLGETRNAELGIQIEVVWRDQRPGHVGDILSNRKRFDPQEKPLPGDLVAVAPQPVPYLVTPRAEYIPELGGSNNVANVMAARSGARQIVNMMETWK
jgi:hypothetical protein